MPEQIPTTPRQISKRAWYVANKDKVKAYREANKTKIAEQRRAWYVANKDKVKAYRKANPELWVNGRARTHNIVGTITPGRISELLEYQQWTCVICSKDLRLGYHVDHILPVSKGGENIDSNIQILCPKCNLQKGMGLWYLPRV